MHRALRRLDLPMGRLLSCAVLAGGADMALWAWQDRLLALWQAIMGFWLQFGALEARITQVSLPVGELQVRTLLVEFPGDFPSLIQTTVAAAAILVLLWVFHWKARSFLPGRYFALAVAGILVASMLQFTFAPGSVQRRGGDEISAQLWSGQLLLMLLPWLLAFTYFILHDRLAHKLALLVASLAFVFLAVPLQAVAHLVVLEAGSLLWSPLLFLVFGSVPILMGVVAFYGWAMSWQ